jgi:small subunit ribosomal protein S20
MAVASNPGLGRKKGKRMGHSLSAVKRERQNVKRNLRNRANMGILRKEMKAFTAAVQAGTAESKTTLAQAYKALDVAARKGTIPKKRADRKKGRLALALAKQAKAAVAAPVSPAAPPAAQ